MKKLISKVIEGKYISADEQLIEFVKINKVENNIILTYFEIDGNDLMNSSFVTNMKQALRYSPNLEFIIEFHKKLKEDVTTWEKKVPQYYDNIRKSLLGLRDNERDIIKKISLRVNFVIEKEDTNFILDKIKKIYSTLRKSNFLYGRGELFFIFLKTQNIALSRNTRREWGRAWNKIREDRKKEEEYGIKRNYRIDMDILDEDDVVKLRFFLPLWHNFFLNGNNIKLYLHSIGDTRYKIKQFFSYLPNEIENDIFIGRRSIGDMSRSESASNIFPVLEFDQGRHPDEIEESIHLIKLYFEFVFNIGNYKGTDEQKINNKETLRNKLIKYLYNLFSSKKLTNEEMEKKSEQWRGETKVKSSLDFNKVYQDFCRIFVERRFSVLLFLFLIRNAIDSKHIFVFINQEKFLNKVDCEINYRLIDRLWLDSKTYSESFCQLIENAQKHSKGHIAYFGLKTYTADPNVSISALPDKAKNRYNLWKEYWETKENGEIREEIKNRNINSNDNNNIFNIRDKNNKIIYQNFLEFFILDDAIENNNAYGILNTLIKQGIVKTELYSVTDLQQEDYPNSKSDDGHKYYIEHYGIRWFAKNINNLNGIFKIYSPFSLKDSAFEVSDEAKYFCSNVHVNQLKRKIKDKEATEQNKIINEYKNLYSNLFSTEYTILIPIAANMLEDKNPKESCKIKKQDFFINLKDYENLNFFECKIDLNDNKFKKFFEKSKQEFLMGVVPKFRIVEKLTEELHKKIKDKGNTFLRIITGEDTNDLYVELISKSIFCLIYSRSKIGIDSFLISIEFGNHKECAKEFIRIFSIFYDKAGTNDLLSKVQIAVCSYNLETRLNEVNFILAGKSIASAYTTAKNFVYYDADASLDFVPLIQFFSSNSFAVETPIFPFDLFLKDSDQKTSWFLNKILKRLKTDIRIKDYGCKIEDVIVRLGSKIYIDTFYEAELLFHNLGTIKRFAYLIALDIVNKVKLKSVEKPFNYIFLLGYENYSATLIQEIQRLLVSYFGNSFKIEWLIDTRTEDFPVVSFEKYSKEILKEISNQKNIMCFTIFPLGSTMSTVYKLHNSFRRGLLSLVRSQVPNVIFSNYSLLAIGDPFIKAGKIEKDPYKRYINKVEKPFDTRYSWYTATLQKENAEEIACINYLLPLEAKWEVMDDFSKQQKQVPILQVDKTSTLLDIYFQTPLPRDVLKYYNKARESIHYLEPKKNSYIRYGHIVRGNNHYQFYFDFVKLTNDLKFEIEKVAKSWGEKLYFNQYNIVISPLQSSNAPFLKIILDNVFKNNLHLLHINIQDTGKESVRTKFEYIAKEMRDIINQNNQNLSFYYVDDAICTGNGLARAYKFIQTLCDQYNLQAPKKFTKVFLLLNRSSYETAQTWVENPNDDWLGFINLCIPSYNTHIKNNEAMCPGCNIRARYELLRKRSATNKLYEHFTLHTLKNLARNQYEYDDWQNERIMSETSYFEWLCLYVDFNNPTQSEIRKSIEGFINAKNYNNKTLGEFLKWIEVDKRDTLLTLMNQIVANENYRRLKSLNMAYMELLYDEKLSEEYEKIRESPKEYLSERFKEYKSMVEKKIWGLLFNCFSQKVSSFEGAFNFISFLKVISRDFLAKNYFIKEAIYKVLETLLKIMISSEGYESPISNPIIESEKQLYLIIASLDKSLQYRILKITIHRLGLMRSRIIINEENVRNILRKFTELDNEKTSLLKKQTLSKSKMFYNYLFSIKAATMEENNDNMCFELMKETSKLLNSASFSKDKDYDSQNFFFPLYLENTRILYDFLDELHKEFITSKQLKCDRIKENYTGYVGKKSLQGRNEIILEMETFIKQKVNLSFCENERLYQNPLNSFINFYEEVFGKIENENKIELQKLTEMLNYFNILEYLDSLPKFSKKESEFNSLPYIFEDICLSIKNMANAKSCYLIYKKEGDVSQLVSRSGYYIDVSDKNPFSVTGDENPFSSFHIGSTEFDLILNGIKLNDSSKTNIKVIEKFTEMVNYIQIDRNGGKFLVFEFSLKKNEKRNFYIFLEYTGNFAEKENLNIEEIKKISLRILCLRNRLSEAFERNYTNVLNFRFDCQYIQSVQGNETHESELQILHITDLHLEDYDYWIDENQWNLFLKDLEKRKGKINLVAVTGDIVDASNDAATAQKKYKRVANLLLDVAKTLWGTKINGDLLLPHDWKRRILITTGNHDYAAMNDTSVGVESRQITVGLPGRSSGGTMQKFAYFIEFLSYFLDAPTQRLLKNDFNEVRTYVGLKLIVGIFNASSKANAYQISKVAFNETKLELVLKVSDWEKEEYKNFKHLVLVHYPYSYSIDYFMDKYMPDDCKELICKNNGPKKCGSCGNERCLYFAYINELKVQIQKHIFKTNKTDKTEFSKCYATECYNKKHKKSLLFRDMEMLYLFLNSKIELNEFVMKLLSDSNMLINQMKNDSAEFQKNFEKIISNKNKEICIVTLAGHTHKLAVKNETKCYVGEKFVDNLKKIYWQILCYDDANIKYRNFCSVSYNNEDLEKESEEDIVNNEDLEKESEEDIVNNEDLEKESEEDIVNNEDLENDLDDEILDDYSFEEPDKE